MLWMSSPCFIDTFKNEKCKIEVLEFTRYEIRKLYFSVSGWAIIPLRRTFGTECYFSFGACSWSEWKFCNSCLIIETRKQLNTYVLADSEKLSSL